MVAKLNLIAAFAVAFIALSANVRQTLAWTAESFYHNKAHPGKCVVKNVLILSPGDVGKVPGQCVQISCLDPAGTASLKGCGDAEPPANCEWGEYIDVNASFPDCCEKKPVCPVELTDESKMYTEIPLLNST